MVGKTRRITCLLVLCSSLLSVGCAVKSQQLKTVRNISSQNTQALLPYTWTLQFGGYQGTVYASESGETIIFSNQLGDAVVLENFTLRETHRLGLFRHFWQIISGRDWNSLYKQGQYIGTFKCGNWLDAGSLNKELTQSNDKIFQQTCKTENNTITQNTILLDDQDRVKYMEFFLLGEEHSIELRKS